MSMEDPSQKARKWAKGTSKKYLGKKIALERLTSSHSRGAEKEEKIFSASRQGPSNAMAREKNGVLARSTIEASAPFAISL